MATLRWHGHRQTAPVLATPASAGGCNQPHRDVDVYSVDVDGSNDVLKVLRTEIDEIEIDLTDDPVVDRARDADGAWFRKGFEAGCDIDPVAENFIPFNDDVGQVDPDADSNPPIGREGIV